MEFHIIDEALLKAILIPNESTFIKYFTIQDGDKGKIEYCVIKSPRTQSTYTGRNLKRLIQTDFFIYSFLKHDLLDSIDIDVPKIGFETGEILSGKSKGTILDFTKPETLDDQLAKIYNLTDEERKLMKESIRPWKDKLSLTADGLY